MHSNFVAIKFFSTSRDFINFHLARKIKMVEESAYIYHKSWIRFKKTERSSQLMSINFTMLERCSRALLGNAAKAKDPAYQNEHFCLDAIFCVCAHFIFKTAITIPNKWKKRTSASSREKEKYGKLTFN